MLVFGSLLGSAQSLHDSGKQNSDRYIQQAIKDWNVRGITITKGDSIICSLAGGYANIEEKQPVTTETIFYRIYGCRRNYRCRSNGK
jgi:hypothetical protein